MIKEAETKKNISIKKRKITPRRKAIFYVRKLLEHIPVDGQFHSPAQLARITGISHSVACDYFELIKFIQMYPMNLDFGQMPLRADSKRNSMPCIRKTIKNRKEEETKHSLEES